MRWLAAVVPVVLFAAASHAAPRQSNPAFLGIGFTNGPTGCIIETVTPGGPAAEAGIEAGDSILAFDKVPLDRTQPCDQLVATITTHAPGDRIRVDVLRNAVRRDLVATLATRAEVVQRRVGQRIGSTDLVDVDDPRHHYDLADRGKTLVVGWFVDRCSGCARVFDRVADGLKQRAHSNVAVLAVTARGFRDDLGDLRKSFSSPVALAVADNDTFEALAMADQDRAFFMVIDCKGIVRLVTPLAPDSDDLEAAVDEVLAGAEQAEHARTARH
jgi:hypothetical protein